MKKLKLMKSLENIQKLHQEMTNYSFWKILHLLDKLKKLSLFDKLHSVVNYWLLIIILSKVEIENLRDF